MSDFDPYYKWLGIPPQEQPPNHYQLLGIQMLEQSTDVIEAAANRQMAYLQELSSGNDHIDEAQGLLGEVARARVCLLTAESKARYDAELVSTLDSLPEAEETAPENVAVPKFDSADRGAAAPRRPAARRSGGKKRGSTARRSGRRSPPTKNASRGAAREEEEVATPSGASSLQIKIIAAAAPAVVILVIGIVWMVAGGDSSSKQGEKNNKENKTGSGASLDQGNEKDPLAATATKQIGNQTEDTRANSPAKQVNNQPASQVTKKEAPPTPPAVATPPSPPETLSTEEKARLQLTKTYKLEEEDFSHTWHLVNEQTRNLEALETSGSSGTTGGAEFEAELKQRVDAKKKEIIDRWLYVKSQPEGVSVALDQEYNDLQREIHNPWSPPKAIMVKDNIPKITSVRAEVEQEFASRKPTKTNPAVLRLIKDIRTRYAELTQKAEVIGLLEKAGGTLAEAPEVPKAARDTPEQPASLPADNADVQDDIASAKETASAEEGGETDAEETPQEPAASFAVLKDQLTALEKETKLSLGAFNKGAKEYIKQKKDLVKRIKAGEALYARRAKIQDGIQYPEKKTEFGQETDAKVTKPLNELKKQLQNLNKPDAAAMEGNLSRAEKLLKQIEGTPQYQEKPGSIDSLAEKIAKYRKGLNVQQAKMAK